MPKNGLLKKGWLICFMLVSMFLAGTMGCSPEPNVQSNADAASQGPSAAVTTDWSLSSDCVQCHSAEAASLNNTNCLAGAQAHQDESITCTDCHTDELKLTSVHKGADEPSAVTALRNTKVANDACMSCHDGFEELAALTADVRVTDSQGKSTNPHALPESQSHDGLICSDCHVSHAVSDAAAEARSTCLSCHHMDVFECGTCHN